ncbi:MAG: hypothetical protein Q4F54_00320 [Coriobacteriia bacterium]|nr:hypothetical protein [Coriobacteriia bacterium]
MVNDELGNGMPNISVCFEDLNADRRARLQARQTGQAIYSTVTDASGNYFLLVAKGINGILRFGATIYDTTDNT